MPYRSIFQIGFSTSSKVLRHQYTAFQKNVHKYKYFRAELNQQIPEHIKLIKKNDLQKNFDKEESYLKSRKTIQVFLSHYNLKKIVGKTNKQEFIRLTQDRPIAIAYRIRKDDDEFKFISHVVIVERYDSKKQKFIIRDSG